MDRSTTQKIVFALAPLNFLVLPFLIPFGIIGSLVILMVCAFWLVRSEYYTAKRKGLMLTMWGLALTAVSCFYYFFGAAVDAADGGTLAAAKSALPWVFAALVVIAIIVNLFCGLLLRQREVAVAVS